MEEVYAINYLTQNRQFITNKRNEIENVLNSKDIEYKKFNSYKNAIEWLEFKKKEEKEKTLILKYDFKISEDGRKKIIIKDQNDNDILNENIMNKLKLTKDDVYINTENTNYYYEELIGLYLSLKIALKINIVKEILVNSELILNYWLKGMYLNINSEIKKLLYICISLCNKFEKNNGRLILKG